MEGEPSEIGVFKSGSSDDSIFVANLRVQIVARYVVFVLNKPTRARVKSTRRVSEGPFSILRSGVTKRAFLVTSW